MKTDDRKQPSIGSEYTIITNRDYNDQHPLDLEANFEELTNYLPSDFDFSNKTVGGRQAKTAVKAADTSDGSADESKDEKKIIDELYDTYIEMHRNEIGFLDSDDLFPRSYHWRIDDRYAPGKKEILEEAIKLHKRIEDTQAYQDYVDKKKRNKIVNMSWDD